MTGTIRRLAATGLAALLLAAGGLQAAWLEGLRWFEHDGYTRVVFDLSEAVEFRVAPALDKGYVDVILQGELSRRMPEEKAIGARGVLSARQLRATSTSLTWRILCEDVTRVTKMALDESPYKVVVDFHVAGAAPAAAPGRAAPAVQPAIERPVAPPEVRPRSEAAPAKTAAARPADDARAQAEARYAGLSADPKRRLIVGELLLQLGDTVQALPQLERAAALAPDHPYAAWLLGAAYLSTGDEYRARLQFEKLVEDAEWGEGARARLADLTPPDPAGVVPGGEIREADLSEFLAVLRAGRNLEPADLYAPPKASGGAGFWPGLLLGSLLGIVGWGLQQLWLRQRSLDAKRRQIVADSQKGGGSNGSAAAAAGLAGIDYSDVSRRVREELEQHMLDLEKPLKASGKEPIPSAGAQPAAKGVDLESLSLEERVYLMADQRRSIVEIAEELNMGVDEVRLVLELREQAGQLGNG